MTSPVLRNGVVLLALAGVTMLGCKKKGEGEADAEADASIAAVDAEVDAAPAVDAAVEEEAGVDASTTALPRPTVTATAKPAATISAATLALCARAASARDRGSPAAPGLEKQCVAAGGTVPAAGGTATPAAPAAPTPKTEPAVCARARTAKEKGSPAAAGLEAQCRAAGGTP